MKFLSLLIVCIGVAGAIYPCLNIIEEIMWGSVPAFFEGIFQLSVCAGVIGVGAVLWRLAENRTV